jgi:phage terminase small subunit
MAGLTPKQVKFVEEYLTDFNATQAAIRAGYSPKTARVQASRMLTNVNLQSELARRVHAIKDPEAMTLEEAVIELSKLAQANMGTYASWGPLGVELEASERLPEGATAAVIEVTETVTNAGRTVRFMLHDKRGALDSIVKIRQWQIEQAKMEALEERIAALEERLNELGIKTHSNGKGIGYLLRR